MFLEHFEPGSQQPLRLSDGSAIYAAFDAIAAPGHSHGPAPRGHIFVERVQGVFRRRGDKILLRRLKRQWNLTPIPHYVPAMRSLLPCLKETGGRYAWLGITLADLSRQHWRPEDRRLFEKWSDSPACEAILAEAFERARAQERTNLLQSAPTLSPEELEAYPPEFWSCLVRLPDGFIGMTPESTRTNPELHPLYGEWARQNKPDATFIPDPRLQAWPLWPEVPAELRPFFQIDPVRSVPSVRSHPKNRYEEVMIRQALAWKHQGIMEAVKAVEEARQAQNS